MIFFVPCGKLILLNFKKAGVMMKKIIAIFLCFVLVFSCSVLLCGCGDKKNESEFSTPFGEEYYNTIGAGRGSFFFELIDETGFNQRFQINTDCLYLLEALRENNMVLTSTGETITAIAGIVADDSNGRVWVLYDEGKKVEGSYEEIKITAERKYSFISESK